MRRQGPSPPPTAWQETKPAIVAGIAVEIRQRGFLQPGVRMWRRRGELVDVLVLRSKHGTSCSIHAGCQPVVLGKHQPDVGACIFWTVAPHLPALVDDASGPAFVGAVLLPELLRLDTSLLRIQSLDVAIELVQHRTREFCVSGKPSPAFDDALKRLQACRRSSNILEN